MAHWKNGWYRVRLFCYCTTEMYLLIIYLMYKYVYLCYIHLLLESRIHFRSSVQHMTSTYHRHNQHHGRCCLLRIAATDLRNENWVRLASLYIFFLSLSFCPLLEIIRSIRGAWHYAFSISYGTVHKHYGCHEYYDLSAVWTFDD